MTDKRELERAVAAYAEKHRKENLAAHLGPVGIGGFLTTVAALVGASALVPIIIGITCLVLMTAMSSFNRKALASAPVETKELGSEVETQPRFQTEYDCPNYEQTSFDKRLADEGVISILDVSTCEYAGALKNYCPLCRPILASQKAERERIEEDRRRERQREHEKNMREIRQRQEKRATDSDWAALDAMSKAERERVQAFHETSMLHVDEYEVRSSANGKLKTFTDGDLRKPKVTNCKNHPENKPVETWFVGLCPTCRLAAMKTQDERDRLAKIESNKAKRAAAKAEKERLFEERRHVNLNGLHLYRPDGVPEGAVPSLLHGREIDPLATHSFIVWKWTEDGDNIKFYKEPVVADAYSVRSDGGPVKTWYSVTDGTGRYVGDYSTTNGHLPKERHELALKAHFGDGDIKFEKKVADYINYTKDNGWNR